MAYQEKGKGERRSGRKGVRRVVRKGVRKERRADESPREFRTETVSDVATEVGTEVGAERQPTAEHQPMAEYQPTAERQTMAERQPVVRSELAAGKHKESEGPAKPEKPRKPEKIQKVEEPEMSEKLQKRSPVLVITGACGFIGSWAVEVAKKEGWKVRACDLPSAFAGRDKFGKAKYPQLVRKLADEVVECDVTKPETLRGIFDGADYVFHIAAILKYDVPWELLYNVNVEGTKNVFEEIIRRGVDVKRVVVWSTNGVYGVPEKNEVPIREGNPAKPVTRYGLSKFLQEKWAWIYHRKHGIPVTVIRPTAVYGPRETYMFLNFLKTLKKQKFLFIPSNLSFGFPSVHAIDVVRSAMYLSQLKEADGEDYIINDDSNLSAIDVMRFAAEVFDKPFYLLPPVPIEILRGIVFVSSFISKLVSKFGARADMEFEFSFMFGYDMSCSNEKLKSTGFKFMYPDFKEGMKETVRWYQDHGLL